MTVRFDRVRNFRDVGGLPTIDGGTVRTGLLFRSGHFGDATPADVERMATLGIATCVDLRSPRDASGKPPGRLPAATTLVECPISGDHPGWRALATRDPIGIWRNVIRPGASTELLRDTYRMHALDHAGAFGAAVNALAAPGALPAVVHCRQGKDRTGWLIALVLDLIGVSRDDVIDEYLRSNAAARPVLAGPLLRQAIRPMVRVDRDWLLHSFDSVVEVHGSVEAYRRAAGISEGAEDALRDALVGESGD